MREAVERAWPEWPFPLDDAEVRDLWAGLTVPERAAAVERAWPQDHT